MIKDSSSCCCFDCFVTYLRLHLSVYIDGQIRHGTVEEKGKLVKNNAIELSDHARTKKPTLFCFTSSAIVSTINQYVK